MALWPSHAPTGEKSWSYRGGSAHRMAACSGGCLMVQDRSLSSCQTLRPSQPTGCAGIATLTGVRASGIPHAEASRDGCSETARAHRHHASRGREQNPVQSPEPGAPGLGGKHPQLMAKDEDLDLTITRFAFGSARRSNPRRIRYRIETSTRACYGIDVTVREARVSDPLRRRRTWRSSARAAGGKAWRRWRRAFSVSSGCLRTERLGCRGSERRLGT